jgi:hypothetical protein
MKDENGPKIEEMQLKVKAQSFQCSRIQELYGNAWVDISFSSKQYPTPNDFHGFCIIYIGHVGFDYK